MNWLLILAFTFSSSIDNLGVGVSYGIRNIQIRLRSNLLIAVICFLFSEAGILFGLWVAKWLPGILPMLLGALLLFIIGIRIILLGIPRNNKQNSDTEGKSATKGFARFVKIPKLMDANDSSEIGLAESIFLGIALSANALTNGIGAGLLGLSPHVISILAALGSFATIWLGVRLGRKAANIRIGSFTVGQFGTVLSGAILLIVAYTSLF